MLKIEQSHIGGKTVIQLAGHARSEHIGIIANALESARPPIAMDLTELLVIDIDVARFLANCERRKGIELLHCAMYIRLWITLESTDAIDRESAA
jgi:hypothetical protein